MHLYIIHKYYLFDNVNCFCRLGGGSLWDVTEPLGIIAWLKTETDGSLNSVVTIILYKIYMYYVYPLLDNIFVVVKKISHLK